MSGDAVIARSTRNGFDGIRDDSRQAVNTSIDHAHNVSVLASQELFATEGQGLLDGPYRHVPSK